jgi:hypothetical protein
MKVSGHFTSGERAPDTPCIGGWASPGLDTVEKRKKSLRRSCRESNPGRPTRSLVAILTELHRLQDKWNKVATFCLSVT